MTNVSCTSATISWTTENAVGTRVEYGQDDTYDSIAEPASTGDSHQVSLTGLEPARNYHYRVVAESETGHRATSQELAFRTTSNLFVGAYYYPWWTHRKWEEQPEGYLHTPQLGWYDSQTPAIIDQHIAWSVDSGIDFLSVSWWGTRWDYTPDSGGHRDRALSQLMKAIETREPLDLQVCILYESSGRLTGNGDFLPGTITGDGRTNEQVLTDDFTYFADNYFGRPSYLTIGDRPIVFIYMGERFTADWQQAMASIRQAMALRGYDPMIIGMHDFWQGPDWHKLYIFDAATTYNFYTPDPSLVPIEDNKIQHEGYLAQVAKRYEAWKPIVQAMIPNVMPGYDDSIREGPDRPILEATPEFFEAQWAMAGDHLEPDRPWNMVMITSFNEWHEDTQIEPDDTKYGMTYLDVVREQSRILR